MMRNTQTFRGLPVWHPICLSAPEDQLKAYADPEVRKKLHDEAVEFKSGPAIGICSTWWDYMVVQTAVLEKNKWMEGKTLGEIAKTQGKGIIDCLCDLPIEENLDTPKSSTTRTRSSAFRTVARTSSSRAASASRPGSSRSGCARSRSCRWSRPCGG
jgi:N-acyl-D-aspartate/D-glutamate deacylase